VLEYGPKRWLSIWNLMDLATYFLQVCFISIRFDLIQFIQFDSMQFDMFTVLGGIWNFMDLATYFLQVRTIINQSINQFTFLVFGTHQRSQQATSRKTTYTKH